MKTLKIPQATKMGFIEVPIGGCFDGSYPDSKTRRGRVIGGGADKSYADGRRTECVCI